MTIEPEYFCSLIELFYKKRNGEKREIELNKSLSDRLCEILFQFKVTPGIDWNGNFDAKRFDYWMKTVKTWSRDNDRYEAAMHTVGSGLSYAELDEDKLPQTAAIFAVHEATQCNDIVALEQRLTDRKLSGNIQEYYKAIWDSAKAKFQIPFVDYKMAGVFAFFNEPLNEYKLQKIFSEEGISISVWRNVLKSMRPLLVETNGNYTILHNDIRVYLSRIIGRDNDWIEEVYSFLASYYINLSEEEKGYSYYNDVLRFLIYAKRASEFKNIFTPDFIISSFVYGIGINEIYSRANDFLKRTIDENVIDWEQMKCLAFGYLTIDQIEKSQNEIEGANFRTTNQYIPVNSYECYVKPLASWNSEIITSVLSLASDLIDNNHADRAEALLYNWFYDVTLEQIYDCVKVNDGTNENDDKTKEVVFDICERIFADNPVNSFFETGIFFYRNNPKRIQEWYDDWLSENGKLWQEPLYDTEGMPIQLIMFEDRIEIHNPGGLYGRITIDQLGKIQPDTRNPVLASALETLGIIENRYSGIPTIRMEMEKYNLRQPEFLDERGSFIVKLYKESKNDYEDMSNDEETNNLIVFCKTPRTRKEICDYLGLNSVTYAIQTYVNPLVEAGVIKLSIPDKPKSPKQLYYSGEREK